MSTILFPSVTLVLDLMSVTYCWPQSVVYITDF